MATIGRCSPAAALLGVLLACLPLVPTPARAGAALRRYTNAPFGYSVTIPPGWEVDDRRAPVALRLVAPAAVIDIFDQQLDDVDADTYIQYSNRSVLHAWNGQTLLRREATRRAGQAAFYLEWLRPPLALVRPDLRRYGEWHLVRGRNRVLTVTLKAAAEAWAEAQRDAERMLADLRWLPPAGRAAWNLPRSPGRDWTSWQAGTPLRWRLPPAGQLMWGMFDPRFGTEPNTFRIDDFAAFERDEIGARLGLIMTYLPFGAPFPAAMMERAARDGRLVLLTLQSDPLDGLASEAIYRRGRSRYYRILDGKDDGYLREYARAARRFGKPFLFRLDNEMNGDWTAWSAFQYGKDTDLFVAVWRHVREVFRAEGAENAIWVWNPNCESFPRFAWQHHSRYWPGGDAVDLVGLTCYNTAGSPAKWRSFQELYRPVYEEYMRLYGDKPFLITEFSSHTEGGDKAQWVREMFGALAAMPNIRMAVWWNARDQIGDYRLTEPRGALLAFREGIRAPRFVNTVRYEGTQRNASDDDAPAYGSMP